MLLFYFLFAWPWPTYCYMNVISSEYELQNLILSKKKKVKKLQNMMESFIWVVKIKLLCVGLAVPELACVFVNQ